MLAMTTERKDDKPQQSENIFDRVRREVREKQERESEDRRRFDEMLRGRGENHR
jgi:hypothetical protein